MLRALQRDFGSGRPSVPSIAEPSRAIGFGLAPVTFGVMSAAARRADLRSGSAASRARADDTNRLCSGKPSWLPVETVHDSSLARFGKFENMQARLDLRREIGFASVNARGAGSGLLR
jgi:hypothetical protein